MGKKSSGPKAPNPYKTAKAQTQANIAALQESARLNRYDVSGPFGSTQWDKPTDDPATWSMSTSLSPEQQRMFDLTSSKAYGGLQDFDLGPVRTDYGADAQAVEQASFDRAMNLMRPGFDERERRLETRLATQGIPVGGEAYQGEMDRFDRMRNEAEMGAALEAVGAGRQEQSRLFGLEQTGRQQRIAELAQILGMSPAAPQAPATAQYQAAPPDLAGLIQSNYQTQSGQHGAKKSGATGLASTGIMAGMLM